MKNKYKAFITKNHLELEKVIEHSQDGSFDFIFKTDDFQDSDKLAEDLNPIFPFLKTIRVCLVSEASKNKEDYVSPIWRNTPEEEKLKAKHEALSQDKNDPPKEDEESEDEKDDVPFDLEAYQKAKLHELQKDIPKAHNDDRLYKPGDLIFGKRINKEASPIRDIDFSNTVLEKNICLEGTVFLKDFEQINAKTNLATLGLTDYTNSIYIKKFIKVENKTRNEFFEDFIQIGDRIKVCGNVEYDTFSKEKVMNAHSIELLEPVKRVDTAEDKRIELHLHTQYSAMDSTAKIKDILQRVEDFGHEAVAITDHGVLQAYPEIQQLTRNSDLKVLYGLEGYLVNTGDKVIEGNKDQSIDDPFIFFDLETTGTSIYTDDVIEIAAVLVEDGEIKDTFQTFVNPHRNLPKKIIELTGITDDDVKNGKELDEAFSAFLDFVGDNILAAHNATFDIGFLKRWLKDKGKPFNYTYIDSLPLARLTVPEIARYNMNRLCSFFKIKNKQAHRAISDSIASAQVLLKLFERAKEKGVTTVQGLNSLIDVETMAKKNAHTNHVIIFPKNQEGLHDLYKLVSDSHLKYFNKRPRIPKEILNSTRKNLLIGSACASGELFEAIVENAPQEVLEEIASFYDFLEVQPIDNNRFLMHRNPRITEEDLRGFNKTIIKLGERLNKPVVATGDVHFVDPEDSIFREVIKSVSSKSTSNYHIPLYLRNTKEMLEEFSYLSPDKRKEIVIDNPKLIAGMIEEVKPVPDGTFPPSIEGAEEDIKGRTYAKAHELYGSELPEIVQNRIDKELNSIINNGYAVLYLIAQKLVKHSEDAGFLVGSRGSVGSSFVARLCGITEVNSLPAHYLCPNCHYVEFPENSALVGPDLEDKECPNCGTKLNKDGYDIPFETFLGFEGDKEPDIDLNFSGDNQAEAHRYTEELFGQGKTFRAGTISTLADKTAYGYAKNYAEMRGATLSNAEIERLKLGIAGIKRTTGQHPGGIMVVPKDHDIYEFSPIQHPADDTTTDIITTHFDYHSISGRLLKLDILGHDDPTMLRNLELITGVDPRSIPIDDKDVLSLFSSTEALKLKKKYNSDLGINGVPEFGTNFVQQIVRETKPKYLTDLIRISGLSHGTDVWTNNAQDIIRNKITDITGVICTRDDIMLDLLRYGLEPKDAFTIMERVRKGKKLTPEFEKTMKEHDVPQWYIDSCNTIKYMFPKAHAAAYVMMAFRIAWYKIHYPLAYYACYFGIRAKEFDLKVISAGYDAILAEINRLKDLQRSGSLTNKESLSMTSLELALEMYARGFSCESIDLKRSKAHQFVINEENKSLIPPFTTVSGMGDQAAESLYEILQQEDIISQEDLLKRTKITKTNLTALEELGCLSNIPKSNQVSFF